MCPDRKLDWFKENGFTREEVRSLKAAVIAYWGKKYGSEINNAEEVDSQRKSKVQFFPLFYIEFCLISIKSVQNGKKLRLLLKKSDPMITSRRIFKSQPSHLRQ